MACSKLEARGHLLHKTGTPPKHFSRECIYQDGSEVTKKNGYLGQHATVFQSEVYAIQKASEILRNMDTRSVCIFTDSQAALQALAKVQINSSVVKNCILELNKLGASTSVEIKWIKAHFGFTGNEMACLLYTSPSPRDS